MRLKSILLSAFAGVLLFSACDNEVDINADWKDVPVVFGLLDVDSTEQFIRISRVFLGEGDALAFAQTQDSLYYKDGDIVAKVSEFINGNETRNWILDRRTDIAKDTGIFASPGQVLYSFEVPSNNKLKTNAEYFLSVVNNKSGNELTGKTKLVRKVNVATPSQFSQTANIFPQQKTFVKWTSSENGRLYEVFLKFIYREYPDGLPQNVTRKEVSINLGRLTATNDAGGEELQREIDNKEIYQTLASFISPATPENPMLRFADSLYFVVNAADEDLYTYLNVNQPSNTIAQERPQFTNIVNGLGLFASRNTYIRRLPIGPLTSDSLRNNSITEALNFQ
jgi:hypothetical protein